MADGYDVKKVIGIGTNAVRVGNDRNGNRYLYNSGNTTLEICNSLGDAYGTGYPVPPGAEFKFESTYGTQGQYGPIFVASSVAGGECRLINIGG